MRVRDLTALTAVLVASACSDGSVDGSGAGGSTSSAPSTGPASSSGTGGAGGGPTCAPDTVYVAPDGSGDACSCASPCALETGRDHARALAGKAAGDVIVELAGGTYRLSKTF